MYHTQQPFVRQRTSSTSSTCTTLSSTPSSSTVTAMASIKSSSKRHGENVQVTVRCRPPNQNEHGSCWDVQQSKIVSTDHRLKKQHEFQFDHVLYGSDNEILYAKSISNLINQAMEGYNATVFAYGQTASGKTFVSNLACHTMFSLLKWPVIVDHGSEAEPGVIPCSVDNVFDFIKKAITREFLLRVSYLEIYNETIKDLLNPSNDNLKIHQDKIRGVYVTPLTEEVVTSPEDVLRIIERGEANRHISSTDYNLHSSRSHTLFQMVIESRERSSTSTSLASHRRTLTSTGYGHYAARSKETVRISQLNLIDLAGSEKAASDQDRRKEGSYINKSLLTLGTVISKLTDPNTGKSPSHIPYRDSKLTRILQTALSGLAKVAVICTISPSNMEESLNTLKFASRVKRITTHAKNDEVMDDKALLQKYRSEIVELKSKLQSTAELLQKEKESALIAERRDHDQQMKLMRNTRNAMKERIDHLTRLILTSSSVVNNDPASATASLQQQLHDVQNGLPSPPADSECKNSNASGLVSTGGSTSQQQEILELRKLLSKVTRESNEKDQHILALEEQLGQQTAINAQLETELSVMKAELELTKQLQANEGGDEKSACSPV
ncbi:ribosomal 40S subunit protein S13 [Mucor velutinosus]|uniref:Kinesin-like protein n=1 Tax=Mucor velutinosus TaxID=708070 RepID=A0AAN7DRK7_9FUNG|nr:ribosomal 40S subunit protein S13 [Mucor velutinosus]